MNTSSLDKFTREKKINNILWVCIRSIAMGVYERTNEGSRTGCEADGGKSWRENIKPYNSFVPVFIKILLYIRVRSWGLRSRGQVSYFLVYILDCFFPLATQSSPHCLLFFPTITTTTTYTTTTTTTNSRT